jgi:hypothetical protein
MGFASARVTPTRVSTIKFGGKDYGVLCGFAGLRRITDKPRSLQVLDKPLGRDLRHQLVAVVHPLAAVEAQREGEGLLKIIRRGRGLLSRGAGPRSRTAAQPAALQNRNVDRNKTTCYTSLIADVGTRCRECGFRTVTTPKEKAMTNMRKYAGGKVTFGTQLLIEDGLLSTIPNQQELQAPRWQAKRRAATVEVPSAVVIPLCHHVSVASLSKK